MSLNQTHNTLFLVLSPTCSQVLRKNAMNVKVSKSTLNSMSSYYYVKWDILQPAFSSVAGSSDQLSGVHLLAPLAAGQDAASWPAASPGRIVLASSKDAAAKPSDSSGLGAKVFFTFPHCSVSSALSEWNNKNTVKCQRVGFCKQILEPGRLKCDEVSVILSGQVKFACWALAAVNKGSHLTQKYQWHMKENVWASCQFPKVLQRLAFMCNLTKIEVRKLWKISYLIHHF